MSIFERKLEASKYFFIFLLLPKFEADVWCNSSNLTFEHGVFRRSPFV